MVPHIRKDYNEKFTQKRFDEFLHYLNTEFNCELRYRSAETPVFIDKKLKNQLLEASNEIVDLICQPNFKNITKNAVPENVCVPNEDDHSMFIVFDYGICEDENGELVPRLIELQGFPSIYAHKHFLEAAYRQYFDIPTNYSSFFSGLSPDDYKKLLGEVILGDMKPENVVLLEIEPEKQGTNIDFYVTQAYYGVKPICITEVIREERKLFYMNDGVKTPILRIYNRVIFDELLKRTDLNLQFHLTEEVDVEWAGHPNWFYRISKFTLPFIKSKYLSETKFLSDFNEIPKDLENYVLKPLFSFAGEGIVFNLTLEDITKIKDPGNYLLQRKVKYAAAVKSLDEGVKCEIRMMYLWKKGTERPIPVINLGRLSKGDLIGVKFNKNKTWVGGTIAYMEND